METKWVLVASLILGSFLSYGSNRHFWVEISPGAGAGWWVYNKGSIDGSKEKNLGWDHTHLSGLYHFDGSFFYEIKKIKIGAGLGYGMMLDSTMLASDHQRFDNHKYSIAEKFVQFFLYYGSVEYSLFTSGKFVFAPFVKLGSFQIYSTHPEADNFGYKFFYEAGFSNHIELGKNFSLLIQPKFMTMNIWPEHRKAEKEKHSIYSFGLNIGVRYKMK